MKDISILKLSEIAYIMKRLSTMRRWKINQAFLIVLFCLQTLVNLGFTAPYPWFTGPLINNGAIVVDRNQWDFFPQGYTYTVPGIRIWGGSGQSVYGVTDSLQIQLIPVYNYQTNNVVSSQGMADSAVEIGWQLFRQANHDYLPDIKLDVFDLIPFGQYQNLDPNKQGIDSVGQGQNQIELVINTQYRSLPFPDHYMYTYFSIGYGWFQKVRLSGFNSYGGGFGTHGVLSRSMEWNADMAIEFQLTQNWVAVFEWNYLYDSPATFRGRRGVDANGLPATVLKTRVDQWSLAPALEYNISQNFGIIFGPWFSLSGNPDNRFFSLNLALNYVTENSTPPSVKHRFPFPFNLLED